MEAEKNLEDQMWEALQKTTPTWVHQEYLLTRSLLLDRYPMERFEDWPFFELEHLVTIVKWESVESVVTEYNEIGQVRKKTYEPAIHCSLGAKGFTFSARKVYFKACKILGDFIGVCLDYSVMDSEAWKPIWEDIHTNLQVAVWDKDTFLHVVRQTKNLHNYVKNDRELHRGKTPPKIALCLLFLVESFGKGLKAIWTGEKGDALPLSNGISIARKLSKDRGLEDYEVYLSLLKASKKFDGTRKEWTDFLSGLLLFMMVERFHREPPPDLVNAAFLAQADLGSLIDIDAETKAYEERKALRKKTNGAIL